MLSKPLSQCVVAMCRNCDLSNTTVCNYVIHRKHRRQSDILHLILSNPNPNMDVTENTKMPSFLCSVLIRELRALENHRHKDAQHGTHFTAELTVTIRIKCCAQGYNNIAMQPRIEPLTSIFRNRDLCHEANIYITERVFILVTNMPSTTQVLTLVTNMPSTSPVLTFGTNMPPTSRILTFGTNMPPMNRVLNIVTNIPPMNRVINIVTNIPPMNRVINIVTNIPPMNGVINIVTSIPPMNRVINIVTNIPPMNRVINIVTNMPPMNRVINIATNIPPMNGVLILVTNMPLTSSWWCVYNHKKMTPQQNIQFCNMSFYCTSAHYSIQHKCLTQLVVHSAKMVAGSS